MKKIEREKLEALVKELARAYFVERNYAKLMQHMSMQISWIGTGANEVCCSMLDATRYLQAEKETYSGKFLLSNEWYHTVFATDELACVMATMDIEAEPGSGYFLHMPLRFSIMLHRKGGKWKAFHVHNSVPYRDQGDATFFDREAAKENYRRVEKIAAVLAAEQLETARHEDALTGILNGEGFAHEIHRLRNENPAVCYALVKFGVNHFRYINQNQGYHMGDRVLRGIAETLVRCCSEQETCARIEKDSFAILAVYHSEEQMDERMTWLDENLVEEKIRLELQSNITFTGGIYIIEPENDEDAKDMLDKALMAEKSVIRDAWKSRYDYFNPRTYEQMLYHSWLIETAPEAILKKEFQLYIQPQVSLATGRVAGGEALVRWVKEDGSMVMPGDFIPLFEQSDFILEFDFYMLECLCQHMHKWMEEGRPMVPVSINQSRRHLDKANYLKRFCEMVDRYQVPHEYIIFELTESAFAEHDSEILALAGELHRRGFRLAIDDFGTGYATLNCLGMVAADILKVDRSLLVDIDTTPRGKMVLKSVIGFAKESEMVVVCEGVETQAQVAYLKKLACDYGQGFYFSRPIPVEQFEDMLMGEDRLPTAPERQMAEVLTL